MLIRPTSRYGGCRPSCTTGRPKNRAAGSVTCTTSSTTRRSWWPRGNACPPTGRQDSRDRQGHRGPHRDRDRGRGLPEPNPELAEIGRVPAGRSTTSDDTESEWETPAPRYTNYRRPSGSGKPETRARTHL